MKVKSLTRPTKLSALIYFSRLRLSVLTCVLILKNEDLMKSSERCPNSLRDCEVMLNQCDLTEHDCRIYDDAIGLQKGKVENWRTEETDAISSHFSNHIKHGVLPGKLEIEEFKDQYEILKSRNWLGVKYKIHNMIAKTKKHSFHKGKRKVSTLNEISHDGYNPLVKVPKENFGLNHHKRDQTTYEFQTVNLESEGQEFQENGVLPSQCENILKHTDAKKKSGRPSLIENLEDFCNDIELPSGPKIVDSADNHSDNYNELYPSDNEERTYTLLSSGDYFSQVARAQTPLLTPNNTCNSPNSCRQLVVLNDNTSNVSLCDSIIREVPSGNEFIGISQTEPKKILSSALQGTLTIKKPRCQQLIEEAGSNQAVNKYSLDPLIEKAGSSQAVNKDSLDPLIENAVSSQAVNKYSLDPLIEKAGSSQAVNKDSLDPLIENAGSSQAVNKDSLDPLIENAGSSQAVNKNSLKPLIQEVCISQAVNKDSLNDSLVNITHEPPVRHNRYKNKGLYCGWKDDEIACILSFFSKHIKLSKIPSKVDCLDCIEENQCLNLRNWVSVKSKVYNIIKSNNKMNLKHMEEIHSCIVEKNPPSATGDIPGSVDCRPKNGGPPLNKSRLQPLIVEAGSSKTVNKDSLNDSLLNITHVSPSVRHYRYKNKGLHCGWRDDEIDSISSYFSKHIKLSKIPSKVECLDCIEENQCLNLRNWVSVKSKVYNIIKSNKKVDLKHMEEIQGCIVENNLSSATGETPGCVDSRPKSGITKSCWKKKRSRKEIVKQQWTPQENEAINTFFEEKINNQSVPGKKDCEKCISLNKCLASRSWVMVKSKVHNIITYNSMNNLQ